MSDNNSNDLNFNDNSFALMDDEQDLAVMALAENKQGPSDTGNQEVDRLNKSNAQPAESKSGAESDKLVETIAMQGEQISQLVNMQSQNIQNTQNQQVDEKVQPKNLKEALGLPDDFVYDDAEAVDDPESDSGRLLNARIAIQQKRMQLADTEKADAKASETEYLKQKDALMKQYKLDEKGYAKFEKQMEQRQFSLEDMYLAINRQQYAENVSRSTARQFSSQRERMTTNIPSLANNAGAPKQPLSDAQVFNTFFAVNDKTFETTI